MPTRILLALTLFACGCSAELVDLDEHVFSCVSDADCAEAEGRVCVWDRCVDREDSPFPVYGIVIEDTTPTEQCAGFASGIDLLGVALAEKGGGIVALGEPFGRSFEFGERPPGSYSDLRSWNRMLIDDQGSPDACPPLASDSVISLGCGGVVFLAFLDVPWSSSYDSESLVPVTPQHEIVVYEHSRQCSSDQSIDYAHFNEAFESYTVRICPRGVFEPGDLWTSPVDACPVLARGQTGISSIPVEYPPYPVHSQLYR